MAGVKIKGHQANELALGETPEGFKVLERKYDGERRWVTEWHVIFTVAGDLGIYVLDYEEPKSENQERDKWFSDFDLPVQRVKAVEVHKIEYVRVED